MTKAVLLSAIGLGSGKAGIFIVTLILARTVDETFFAEYGLFYLLLSAFTGTVGNAIFVTANRYGVVDLERRAISLVAIAGTLVSVIAIWIYGQVFLADLSEEFRAWLTLAVGGAIAFQFVIGICYSKGKQELSAILNIVAAVQLAVGAALAVYIGPNDFFLFYAMSYWIPVAIAAILGKIDRIGSIDRVLLARSARIVFIAVLPLIAAAIFLSPIIAHYATLLKSMESGNEQVAIFSVASQVRLAINMIPVVLGAAYLARLVKGNLTYKTDWDFNLAVCLFVVVLAIVFSESVLRVLNLDTAKAQAFTLIMFIVGAFFSAIKAPVARRLLVRERVWFSVASNGVFGCLFVGLVALQPELNVHSIAQAFCIAQVIHFAVLVIVFHYSDDFDLRFLLGPFFSSVLILILTVYAVYSSLNIAQIIAIVVSGIMLINAHRMLRREAIPHD